MPAIALALLMAAPTPADVEQWAGRYDGAAMEVAAALELGADGRYRYALAYGALDEEGSGTWHREGDAVALVSDPVRPPRFAFLDQSPAPAGTLRVELDLPGGISRQYFGVLLSHANGSRRTQFAEDGIDLPLDLADPPRTVALTLGIYDLQSEPFAIDPAAGYRLRFRFEPNDIGRADLTGTTLTRDEGGALVMERRGLRIRFRRIGADR